MDNLGTSAKARPRIARRVVLIALGLVALNLSLGIGCFLSKWIPAGKALLQEELRVREECDALDAQRVYRPIFFEPSDEDNSWEPLSEAIESIGALTKEQLRAFPSFRDEEEGALPPEEVAKVVAKVEADFVVLKSALRRRWVDPFYYFGFGFHLPLPLVEKSIRVCRILADRASALLEEGRPEEAVDRLILAWGMADHLAVKGFLVNELVRITQGEIAASRLNSFLGDARFDSKALARLEGVLSALDRARPDILECFRRDHLLSRQGIISVGEGGDTKLLYPGGKLIGMPHHLFSVRIMAADCLVILADLFRGVETAATLPLRDRLSRLDELEKEALARKNPMVSLLMLDVSRCWRHYAMDGLRMSLARIAVALARHQGDLGAFPASLEELVPKYLPAIPSDEISGSPFGYSVSGDLATVYSWGEDQDDDGGIPVVNESNDDGAVEDGDVVWTVKRIK